ncbi:MAG: alkane 1-monooxygenase [Pararhodobacter sp.]|nr:alkane 1-monooxygenase [Pararhodobacter sp.]
MPISRLGAALPFWLSLGFLPLIALGAAWGGWWLALAPLYAFGLITLLDAIAGLNTRNPDTDTPVADLFWYRAITVIWFPIQAGLIFGALWWVTHTDHLRPHEVIILFYAIGIATGGVGIVYAHELMHQKTALERWLADLLMASTLYSHFRSEHLRVHHLWVATPRDPVSARYNEGFWRFFGRVLLSSPRSAWRAERAMLRRAGKTMGSLSNPFWLYAALQAGFLLLAWGVGGWVGLALFAYQALVAVLHLELTNYVEHYGLTRRYLGEGRYERVLPRHSWNAAHTASNWLLINLQRHSDHHFKPDRRFPLLQTYDADEAPQLPLGYPAMVVVAAIPPLWRRLMNPRVRAWRRRFYPEITDWSAYKAGTTPMPRGAA